MQNSRDPDGRERLLRATGREQRQHDSRLTPHPSCTYCCYISLSGAHSSCNDGNHCGVYITLGGCQPQHSVRDNQAGRDKSDTGLADSLPGQLVMPGPGCTQCCRYEGNGGWGTGDGLVGKQPSARKGDRSQFSLWRSQKGRQREAATGEKWSYSPMRTLQMYPNPLPRARGIRLHEHSPKPRQPPCCPIGSSVGSQVPQSLTCSLTQPLPCPQRAAALAACGCAQACMGGK